MSRAATLLILALIGATACGGNGAPASDTGPPDTEPPDAGPAPDADSPDAGDAALDWAPCPEGDGECAVLTVPVDYDDPSVGTIDLPVVRFPARGDRIGVLVASAGSGGSSVLEASGFAGRFVPGLGEVVRRFDVVGLELRGNGFSDPEVRCFDDDASRQDWAERLYAAADDDAVATLADELYARCTEGTGVDVRYLGTTHRVRDIERLRQLLGEETISLTGGSYGTWTSAAYALRYPERVRAALLVSALGVSDPFERMESSARGVDDAITAFLSWCDATTCAFHPGTGTSADAYAALLSSLRSAPLTSTLGTLDAADLNRLLGRALWFTGGARPPVAYESLAERLDAAEAGDPNPFLSLFDAATGPTVENTLVEYMNDLAPPPGTTLADWRTRAAALRSELTWAEDVTDREPTVVLPLLFPDRHPIVEIAAIPSAPPFLFIAGDHDPITPRAGAQALATALGNGSVVLDSRIPGHDALWRAPCAQAHAQAYLLDPATLPSSDACPAPVVDEEVVGAVADAVTWDGAANRLRETVIGDLVADAMRAETGADLAVVNGGGARTGIPAASVLPADMGLRRPEAGYAVGPPYDVVVDDVRAVLPFGNRSATTAITGAELWALLEWAVASYDGTSPQGSFLQISGFAFTFDPSASAGARVQSVTAVGGAAIANDESASYTLAMPDFFWYAGTGYDGFIDRAPTLGRTMDEALVDYIVAQSRTPGTVLSLATEGRIEAL